MQFEPQFCNWSGAAETGKSSCICNQLTQWLRFGSFRANMLEHAMSKTTRQAGGRWVPGISGNPLGRPKIIAQVRDAARAHTTLTLERLVSLVDSADEKIALSAAQALLDRGWGRCEQSVAVTTPEKAAPVDHDVDWKSLTPQQCADEYVKLLRRNGEARH